MQYTQASIGKRPLIALRSWILQGLRGILWL